MLYNSDFDCVYYEIMKDSKRKQSTYEDEMDDNKEDVSTNDGANRTSTDD